MERHLTAAETLEPQGDTAARGTWRASERDRLWALTEIVMRSLLTYLVMIAYARDYVGLWAVVAANILLYFKVYAEVHDLGHAWAPKRAGLAARFVPISNPIWGGVSVFRLTHEEHHRYLGTDRDPWLPYYAGHPLRALLYSFIEPERNLKTYIERRGVSRELVLNLLFNLACAACSFGLFHGAYLAHLAIQRATHAFAIFAFNFYPHRLTFSAEAPIGTWNREKELRHLVPLMRLVWGRELVSGITWHNRHHIIGQAHVPAGKYHLLRDQGPFTRAVRDWPIAKVRHITSGAGHA